MLSRNLKIQVRNFALNIQSQYFRPANYTKLPLTNFSRSLFGKSQGSSFFNEEENKQDEKIEENAKEETELKQNNQEKNLETETSEQETKILKQDNEKLNEQLNQYKNEVDKLKRFAAELENTRKRAEREIENVKQYSIKSFAFVMLDVADNIERTLNFTRQSISNSNNLSQSPKPNDDTNSISSNLDSICDSISMIDDTLKKAFSKHSIVRDDCIGKVFDPKIHNVITTVQDPLRQNNTIVNVQTYGYRIYDRVLREARVIIVKNPDNVNKEAQNNQSTNTNISNNKDEGQSMER